MRQADAFHFTPNSENLSQILRHALRLAELAGKEQDAARRDASQRLRQGPSLQSRA
jgi:hypothetical protein